MIFADNTESISPMFGSIENFFQNAANFIIIGNKNCNMLFLYLLYFFVYEYEIEFFDYLLNWRRNKDISVNENINRLTITFS